MMSSGLPSLIELEDVSNWPIESSVFFIVIIIYMFLCVLFVSFFGMLTCKKHF